MKQIVCKHGNPVGVTISPAEFYREPHPGRSEYIIQRMTMPVCSVCILEAAGLGDLAERLDSNGILKA